MSRPVTFLYGTWVEKFTNQEVRYGRDEERGWERFQNHNLIYTLFGRMYCPCDDRQCETHHIGIRQLGFGTNYSTPVHRSISSGRGAIGSICIEDIIRPWEHTEDGCDAHLWDPPFERYIEVEKKPSFTLWVGTLRIPRVELIENISLLSQNILIKLAPCWHRSALGNQKTMEDIIGFGLKVIFGGDYVRCILCRRHRKSNLWKTRKAQSLSTYHMCRLKAFPRRGALLTPTKWLSFLSSSSLTDG